MDAGMRRFDRPRGTMRQIKLLDENDTRNLTRNERCLSMDTNVLTLFKPNQQCQRRGQTANLTAEYFRQPANQYLASSYAYDHE